MYHITWLRFLNKYNYVIAVNPIGGTESQF